MMMRMGGRQDEEEVVDSFDAFYASTHPRISASLALAWSDRDLAVEATDEAFVRAYAAWDRVGQMASPDGWVFRVALNAGRRQARRDRSRRDAERRATSRDEVVTMSSRFDFADQIAVLPPRQRLAIILRYVADLAEEDIARAMGVRRGTVASLLTQAHRRLRITVPAEPDPSRP
jgi:RNA polymerase sigma-70 factor, ECF subfamily